MAAHTIPILEKSIGVMETISLRGSMNQKVLAHEMGIAASSCYRILQTFLASGWLSKEAGGAFCIGPGVRKLVSLSDPYESLRLAYAGLLSTLRDQSGLTVKLSVREGNEFVMLLREESAGLLRVTAQVGAHESLCCGSAGAALSVGLEKKELLAMVENAPARAWSFQTEAQFLKRVASARAQGYCLDSGETHPQLHTLSVLVQSPLPENPATITFIGWATDFEEKNVSVLLKRVRKLAPKQAPIL